MHHPGFWSILEKPIIGLAPMDGVTDQPFRYIQKKYGRPDIVYTEFATVEGFARGVEKPLDDFLYDNSQRPIIAQIYGTTPRFFRETATVLCQLGFDGIDINMGCPAKSVATSGAGAGLIQTPELALEIAQAVMAGVIDWVNGKTADDCENITDQITKVVEAREKQLVVNPAKDSEGNHLPIPVSIKTRVGFDSKIAEDWIKTLLQVEPAAIAVHGRTLRQGYAGEADWAEIAKAVKIAKGSGTLILGNGDVKSMAQAHEKVKTYGVDGILIGRASFGNPWVFSDEAVDEYTRAQVAVEHSELFEKTFKNTERYRFLPMRKHLAWYIKSFPQASEVRQELMQTNSAAEVKEILQRHQLLK